MKYLILILMSTVLMSETCKEKKIAAADQQKPVIENPSMIPVCVQQRIDSISKLPRWNPPASVTSYTWKGKTVYLFSSPCCDFFNPLIDGNCNYLCSPSGGFSGRGDMKCKDFDSTAKKVRVIWKDERK
jgi:hypothetical protein